jgi:protein tyrosine phosphatase type 4A
MSSHCTISAKEIEPLRFLISDCPQQNSLNDYIQLLKSNDVTQLIRISRPTYDKNLLIEAGIEVSEFYFEDGKTPSKELLSEFFKLLDKLSGNGGTMIAIHCVSGIGRAPLLVCCALVRGGMDRLDAVDFIRKRRRGAINKTQLNWVADSKNGFRISSGGFLKKLFNKKLK